MLENIELTLAIILLVATLVLLWRERSQAKEITSLKNEIVMKNAKIEDQRIGLRYYRDKYPPNKRR